VLLLLCNTQAKDIGAFKDSRPLVWILCKRFKDPLPRRSIKIPSTMLEYTTSKGSCEVAFGEVAFSLNEKDIGHERLLKF